MAYKCDNKRMEDKIKTISKYGDAGHGGITRYCFSEADLQARGEFVKRMKAIGAEIKTDDMGNVYATLKGSDPSLPAIATGSHTDSVKNGGNYDGILGVISAMEVLETIAEQKIPHKHNITAMIWTNEEGSLYPPAMMSSGVVMNDYLPAEIAKKFRHEDVLKSVSVLDPTKTFEAALNASGYKGDIKNRLNPKDYCAMFELHIEQGPILEAEKKDIGVVTCVLGMVNYRIKIYGVSDHAGTTPMKYRHDALYGAAKVLQYLHDELDKLDPELVYTTGEIVCHPNVHTVIPDFVEFSLDARHEDPKVIEQVVEVIKSIPKEIVGCTTDSAVAWTRDTVYYDEKLVNYVQESVNELGYSNQRINSGAGHDAQFVAYMLPTTMIFVPSVDGHSHCENEYTPVEKCTQGASVLLNAILKRDAE
ncbi:N-carbamoyl-L-amino-acid hydrolase [Fusobacterium sp. DD29]|uniref:Zn-dependent hydrolase n=1 Tax=unclassified Fusobacterium TaxID=2648384 RepID=UPI001B8C70B9|nr:MULTISPECIES: Zn-dependent hydrolase [unclassified Fusobacterium]MBR8701967.1 N-carbamoyl-L-amino-acid hydrolase [Fusobacterium sp. DD45]MBR8711768.1 N-carbamoyl-L-amino-acid hydrolase [Fusobacterium sp. DD28]MBR8749676.1 N-carbamoyl-L-amino-acid hydrolase [Fusobacterium sp. DD29]MBR8752330.1 N-carbamoyl-L-amino-acid hydrolase [Fusobacterium sp. DD26]MBR8761937.1 N-carbamoyl-L-amino-acid hydrolase [Fusobacterium sp. DD25]